ncbi:MAG: AAA family ATPase [Gaiellaceae bacterium]
MSTITLAAHPKLAALFAALDEAGARWCVLRGETDLLRPAGDVDLLIAAADARHLHDAARRLGFARLPAWGYGSHSFFLAYDASQDLWLKVDAVTELAYGPGFTLATEAESECLARRRRVAGVWVLAESDAFWTLLLHRLLDKKGPPPAPDAERLAELASRGPADGPLARLVVSLCPAGWDLARITGAVERGDWASLAEFEFLLRTAWRLVRRDDIRRREVAGLFWHLAEKWLRPARRTGVSVALLGPDGAGKSTLAADLERSFYLPVRSVYMGLYQNPAPRRTRRLRPVPRTAKRVATQWGRWLEGAYHRRRGRLVVFDRYTYDTLVPNRFRHGRRGRARRWVLARSCPPPDLAVLLDAPSDVLYARKGEHDLDVLERQREAYRALLRRFPRSVVVDATADPERVRPEVTAAVWREYVRRWPPRD